MAKKILWITDPWDVIEHPLETTSRLMQESVAMKIPTFWCSLHDIFIQHGKTIIRAFQVTHADEPLSAASFQFGPERFYRSKDFHQIHYRVDPPVDERYRTPLVMLAQDEDAPVVNPLRHLLMGSEKVEGLRIPRLSPKSFVGTNIDQIMDFMQTVGDTFVVKPLFNAMSKGVDRITYKKSERAETAQTLARLTQNQTAPLFIQEYFPSIADGELRLWFAGYECIGHLRKHPLPGDFKVDIDAGSQVSETTLHAHEKKAAETIGKYLREQKIKLAAVDLIDGKITDFNFTSPGLLVQMEKVMNRNLAKAVMQKLLR